MKSQIMEITPKIAAEMLQFNGINRPISPRIVQEYASYIQDGLWALNGESIKLADDSTLLDGQHRLNAVIASGKSITTYVQFGISKDVFSTIDQGKGRTLADLLYLQDIKYRCAIAAVVSFIYQYDNDLLKTVMRKGRSRISKKLLVEFYLEHKEEINFALNTIVEIHSDFKKLPASPALLAFCFYVFNRNKTHDAKTFFLKVILGENLKKSDIEYKLREKLLENKVSMLKRSSNALIELIFRAWHHHVNNMPVNRLMWGTQSNEIFKL